MVAVATATEPVVAAYGPMQGGFIMNPLSAADQNVDVAEVLYVTIGHEPIGLVPGDKFNFPVNFIGTVTVTAPTPGHRFSGVVYQPDTEYVASQASFPPSGQTSLTKSLPQYLYQQYNDDEDLAAFVSAFNQIVQEYMDWLTTINLPVYTGLNSEMLDFVMEYLYGILRPVLPYGVSKSIGPLNTATMNSIPLNGYSLQGPDQYFLTTDDTYKRIGTWYQWKGDGKQFNIRWIKRRIKRFLTGMDGGPGDTDQTYDISITFGVDGEININLQSIRRTSKFGALMNVGVMNGFALNEFDTTAVSIPISPLVPIFKAAVDAGVLKFPFQLKPIVNI